MEWILNLIIKAKLMALAIFFWRWLMIRAEEA